VPRIHLLLALAAAFLAGASTRTASAQEVIDVKAAALVRDGYLADMDSVHSKVLALANAIPADKYSWRPGPGVRSVSEVFMHLAGEWYFYGPMSAPGRPVTSSRPVRSRRTGSKRWKRSLTRRP
jgi:hypothetical protein